MDRKLTIAKLKSNRIKCVRVRGCACDRAERARERERKSEKSHRERDCAWVQLSERTEAELGRRRKSTRERERD